MSSGASITPPGCTCSSTVVPPALVAPAHSTCQCHFDVQPVQSTSTICKGNPFLATHLLAPPACSINQFTPCPLLQQPQTTSHFTSKPPLVISSLVPTPAMQPDDPCSPQCLVWHSDTFRIIWTSCFHLYLLSYLLPLCCSLPLVYSTSH